MTQSRGRDVVARRTLFVRGREGDWTPVHVTFERPRRQPRGEWGCTYRIDGLDELGGASGPAPIYGVDGVQALTLAMRHVDHLLLHSDAFAMARLSWSEGGEPLRIGSFGGHLFAVNKGDGVRVSEIVRAVELDVEWSLPCRLRIEVLRTDTGRDPVYWTRAWRSDMYRLEPTDASAARRLPSRRADEMVLVEDMLLGGDPPYARTPEEAIDETIVRIKWQLFARPPAAPKRAKPKAPRRKRRR